MFQAEVSERSSVVKELKSSPACVPGRVPRGEGHFISKGSPPRGRALADFIEIEPESEGLTGKYFRTSRAF